MKHSIATMLLILSTTSTVVAEQPVDPLVNADGVKISDADQWPQLREQHLARAIKYLYGTMPPAPKHVTTKVLSSREVMDGAATETLFVMLIHHDKKTVPVRVGLLRPNTTKPYAVVIKNDRWVFDLSAMPPGRKRDQYASQHREETFAAVSKMAIKRGYAVCKFVREDLAVDAANSRQTGVLAMHPDFSWGAIAAWAWGYSPLIDVLVDEQGIAPDRIIATGHSRGGKTALAAAIFDQRIAIASPSASGSCGTGSMEHFTDGGRRQTIDVIVKNHRFWFSPRLAELKSVRPLPIDGHVLHSLVAPRGLINTHGVDDPLANPRGTRMMFENSAAAFELLKSRLPAATHWRPGGHGQTQQDWAAMLDYADAYFQNQPLPARFNNWPVEVCR